MFRFDGPAFGAVAAVLLLVSFAAHADPANFGFEADAVGTAPSAWSVPPPAGAAVVVGVEGPAEFSVYNEFNTVVTPRYGERMFRAGIPRQGNESQNQGDNSISQDFVSETGMLAFSLRLFSFEHRGDDALTIDVIGASGASISETGQGSLTIDVARGQDPSCSTVPCSLEIDVGKSTDTLDSGWLDIDITGLPTGSPLTLVYTLTSGQNEAHPSWVYFDANLNDPPVAVINYAPGQDPGTVALEGDFVVFDCLQSTDANNDPLTCTWEAAGPNVPADNLVEGAFTLYSFPQDGEIDVTLTVSDGELSDTVTESVTITNGAPKVNAVNLEVLEGGTVTALCRYLDPGVLDAHTVTIEIDGMPVTVLDSKTEAQPSLSSGFASGLFDASGLAPGAYDGVCTVDDLEAFGQGSDEFVLSVITQAQLDAREGGSAGDQNSTLGAPIANADGMVIGTLNLLDGDSLDIFELRLPNGSPFPVGAEVNVSVAVPADWDAAILSGGAGDTASAAPFVSSPFVSSPFVSSPFVSSPFVSSPFVSSLFVGVPFVSSPFVSSPFVSSPFVSSPFVSSPFISSGLTFSQFPLSQVGEAAPDGSAISAADVGFSELLPLQQTTLVQEQVRVKAISAEFGTNTEQLFFKVGPGEANLYLALFPQQGAFSAAPYAVTVESSTPPPQEQVLGPACSNAMPLVAPPVPSAILRDGGGAPKTLVVTQRERMIESFQMGDFDGEFLTAMDGYFNHGKVVARVISLPSGIFDSADMNPCDVQAQNAVATQIKAIIQAELANYPSIEYVQIMGGLDIVMPFYSPDETSVGYEGIYIQDLFTQPATPLSVAIAEGNTITDVFYVDAITQPFRGRELYTEDISVSRLVETPAEMILAAQTFVANNGEIPFVSSAATGYDFFIDGGEVNAAILGSLPGAAANAVLNDDTWTVDDLRCGYLGTGAMCPVPGPHGITALGAHMTYNAALSAAGFAANQFSQALGSSESANLLGGGLTVSLGCHSGLSVPDAWALPEDAGFPFDPAKDWVQEAGHWIGSYSFAYGDDLVADRGTEGIIPLVLQNLANGDTLGNALIKAKWQYATGIFEFGVYDEKSTIALNLFGMPQATLAGVSSGGSSPMLPAAGSASATSASIGTLSLNLTELGVTTSSSYDIAKVTDAKGVWYTFDGDAQAIPGRPLLPVVKPIDFREVPLGSTTIHGVALRGGTYTLFQNEDPAFPVQEHDWIRTIAEPQPCVETMSPTQIAGVTRFDTPASTLQTLIVQGGQFQCTSGPGNPPVTGDFRVWDSLNLEALHPQTLDLDADLQPPTATRLDLLADPVSGVVTATLDAVDNGKLTEIIGLVFADDDGSPGGTSTVTAFSTGDISAVTGPHTLMMNNGTGNFLAFQFLDDSGNIAWRTLKGALFLAVEVNITTSVFNVNDVTTLTVEIEGFSTLERPFITIDFGDGTPPQVVALTDGNGDPIAGVVVDPVSGTATYSIDHTYNVSTSTVTVFVEVVAQAAKGSDSKIISQCSDPVGDALNPNADIVACGFSAQGTDVSIEYFVAGSIDPDVQYRIRLPQSSKLLKYSNGQVTGPGGSQLVVTEISSTGGSNDGLRFTFRGARVGWDGESPLEFQLRSQEGSAGGAGVGFDDESQIFSFTP